MYLALCLAMLGSMPATSRVHLETEPPGASIEVVYRNKVYRTSQKTPAVLALPSGEITFVLKKDGFETCKIKQSLIGRIVKLNPIVLVPTGVDYTIKFDPGRLVLVDREPALYARPREALTPCTVKVSRGRHLISLVKFGREDVHKTIVVPAKGKASELAIKAKAKEGQSAMLIENPWMLAIGTWAFTEHGKVKLNMAFLPGGSIEPSYRRYSYIKAEWKRTEGGISFTSWAGAKYTVEILSANLMEAEGEKRKITLIRTEDEAEKTERPKD